MFRKEAAKDVLALTEKQLAELVDPQLPGRGSTFPRRRSVNSSTLIPASYPISLFGSGYAGLGSRSV